MLVTCKWMTIISMMPLISMLLNIKENSGILITLHEVKATINTCVNANNAKYGQYESGTTYLQICMYITESLLIKT